MWKLALAFVAGVAAGWLLAVSTQTPPPTPVPGADPAADRPAGDSPGPTRTPRAHAPEPDNAPPAAGKAKQAKPAKAPSPPAKTLSDAEALALLGDADAAARVTGVDLAARRGLVTVAQLLDRARGDPDSRVRIHAFHLAAGLASDDDGTLGLASAEILAWARDADPEKRSAGLQHLGATGAYGAALGRELLDVGGMPSDIYESAVRTLVAARRFDRLVPDSLDDHSREALVGVLSDALESDESIAPNVAAVLRDVGPPATSGETSSYCVLAISAGAPALVRDLVKSPSASPEVQALALQTLFDDAAQAQSAVGVAEEVLTNTSSSAGRRRWILDNVGTSLTQTGAAGLAVLRRVADHDANAWVRELAAEYLSSAAPR